MALLSLQYYKIIASDIINKKNCNNGCKKSVYCDLHNDGQTDSLEAGLQNLRVVVGKTLNGTKGLYFLLPV